MKKRTAISYFGSSTKLAKKLKITKQSISQWGDDVPPLRAYQIERITNGKLKADFSPSSDLESQQEQSSCAH
jgi:DNA-binding transcriptional regulator YdaS (Cro superfamily)